MLKKWAKSIVKLYQEVIVPQWELKETPITVNPSYAENVQNQDFTEEQIAQIAKEYLQVDHWVGADENLKKWFF